jgi:Arc/MetJ-type ribon-helix-helix transcriptional regulator
MVKTTVYLSEPLKSRVTRIAASEGRSEAEVIRAALEEYTAQRARPRPRAPLFDGKGPTDLAERDEEYLALGFGQD